MKSKITNLTIVLIFLLTVFLWFSILNDAIIEIWKYINFLSITGVWEFFVSIMYQEFFILLVMSILLSKLYLRINSNYFNTLKWFFKNQIKKIEYKDIWKFCIKYYLIYFLILRILTFIMIYFELQIPWFGWKQLVSEIFLWYDLNNLTNIFVVFILVAIVAPITEEIVYRWFVQKILSEQFNPIWTIILSSFIFTFVHLDFAVFGQLFILSILLSIIYHKTKSISHTIMFHVLVNSFSFFMMLIISN